MSSAPNPISSTFSSARLQPLIATISRITRQYPGLIAFASAFSLSLPWIVKNYHDYLALGPGGLPYNAAGWLLSLFFKLWAREPLGTAVYDKDPNKASWLEDPESIPERRGTRPTGSFFVLPARQLDKVPDEAMFPVSGT